MNTASFPAGIAAVLALLSCSTPAERARPTAALKVQVIQLRQEPLPRHLLGVGTVRPRSWTQVSSRIQQVIIELPVQEGDPVRAGQLLARLDDQQLAAQERAAAAEHAATQEGLRQAEAGLHLAEAEAELARTTYGRYSRLLEKSAVSRQEHDQVEARNRVAEAALAQAQAGVEAARSRQQQAESGLAAAAAILGYSRITAPSSGRVLTREMDPGDLALPGRPILTLAGAGGWRADITIDAARAARLATGGICRIESEGIEPVHAKIERIVPAADPASRTIEVQVGLPADRPWRAGGVARALFELAAEPGLRIPQAARWTQGQLELALVLGAEGRAERRMIRTGPLIDGHYEVLAGLQDGERVVVSDPARIADGSRLEPRR